MNFTQLINSAARNLADFSKEERTVENATKFLNEAVECNSDVNENKYCLSNFNYAVKRVIEKSNN